MQPIEPLTPQDCDLQDFAFMPLDVRRLRDSDLASAESPEACWAAVLLWAASWHQVPAASLPDDDRVLSNLAGYGRVIKEWMRVKQGALRGWVKCSDGRLYHPVVAEKACEAWDAKRRQRWKTECARIKKHNDRHKTRHDIPDYESWLSSGCPAGQPLVVPRDKPRCPDPVPQEMASKGQGEGQRQLNTEIPSSSSLCSTPRAVRGDDDKPQNVAEWIEVFADLHGVDVDHRSFHDRKKFWPLAAAWTNAGVTVGQMRAACAKAFATASEPIAWLPAYADRVLAGMQAPPPPSRPEPKSFAQKDREAGWARWEQMSGRPHPERLAEQAPITIDTEVRHVAALEGR